MGSKRKGMTMIELMVALLLSVICAITLIYITMMKTNSQSDLDSQSQMLAIDGFFNDVYREFKDANTVEVYQEDEDYVTLTLATAEGEGTIYSFSAGSGELKKDNIPLFKCENVTVLKTANNLYIGVKVEGDKLIELSAFK